MPVLTQTCAGSVYVSTYSDAGVHPYAVAHESVPILLPRDYRRPWAWLAALAPYLAPSLHSTIRVFFATLIEMALLHTVVVGLSYALCRLWAQRSARHAQLYRWYMPSVALLFSNISTLLLLSFVLVWDSRLPVDRRAQQAAGMDLSQWIGDAHDAQQHPWLAPLAAAAREWNTEWLVRNLIGGMSAGVALGGTSLFSRSGPTGAPPCWGAGHAAGPTDPGGDAAPHCASPRLAQCDVSHAARPCGKPARDCSLLPSLAT